MIPLIILGYSKHALTMSALFDQTPTANDMITAALSVGVIENKKGVIITKVSSLPLMEGEEDLCRIQWSMKVKRVQ